MDFYNLIEDIEKIIIALKEENINIPIIVEGEKDVEALRKFGINGIIITINSGISIIDFCDKIARKYNDIIILTDWDRKGGFICHTIEKNLEGRVKYNLYYRELLATKTLTKTVEGLYSWFNSIKEKSKI